MARDRFPSLKCRRTEDFRVQLGESNINLFNFYRCYVQEPDRFEDIILPALATVAQVQEWGPAVGTDARDGSRPHSSDACTRGGLAAELPAISWPTPGSAT